MEEQNPYLAPQAAVEFPVPVETLQLGGRWERLGAILIDSLISGSIGFGIMLYTGAFQAMMHLVRAGGRPDLLWSVKWGAVSFALYCMVQAYPLSRSGQSWGKKLLKLRIVDLEGRKPGLPTLLFLRYGLRIAVGLVPVVGGLLVIVDDLMIFREDRRCAHDLIAGTRVVVAEPSDGVSA